MSWKIKVPLGINQKNFFEEYGDITIKNEDIGIDITLSLSIQSLDGKTKKPGLFVKSFNLSKMKDTSLKQKLEERLIGDFYKVFNKNESSSLEIINEITKFLKNNKELKNRIQELNDLIKEEAEWKKTIEEFFKSPLKNKNPKIIEKIKTKIDEHFPDDSEIIELKTGGIAVITKQKNISEEIKEKLKKYDPFASIRPKEEMKKSEKLNKNIEEELRKHLITVYVVYPDFNYKDIIIEKLNGQKKMKPEEGMKI